MDLTTLFIVLFAALLHASWNIALKKYASLETVIGQTILSALVGAVGVSYFGAISNTALLYLLLGAPFHVLARYFSIRAFLSGDLSQSYPMVRGTIPVMVALLSFIVLGETLSAFGFFAIFLMSLSVGALGWRGGKTPGNFDAKPLLYALLTAGSAAVYNVTDGAGIRVSENTLGFTFWLFLLDGLASSIVLSGFVYLKTGKVRPGLGVAGVAAGLIQLLSFGMILFAMKSAPIALVAAARETSILFALLLSSVLLKEKITGWRLASSCGILAATLMVRMS
ncbi:DMT family transporter [Roseibium sp. SCP14]|uniref:DMT family transporter n=1 Tax=Roseibium sp. SCP14 TaxID=3141375 RepID=UPI00333D088D